jgi:hypothetical protein
VVGSWFTVKQGALDRSVQLHQVDRTGPTATLTTDLGTIGPYLTGFELSAKTTGTFGLDFTSSAPPPSDTTVFTLVSGGPNLDAAAASVQWITMSSKFGQGHVDALVLPEALRQMVGTVSSWSALGAIAVSGVDPRTLRAKPLNSFVAFQYVGAGGDFGLPQGNFRATVSSINPSFGP